jgi:dCMP deaminase
MTQAQSSKLPKWTILNTLHSSLGTPNISWEFFDDEETASTRFSHLASTRADSDFKYLTLMPYDHAKHKTHLTGYRPSFEQLYMDLAVSLSKRTTCSRLGVGTVITTTDYRQILAVGYNGNASGLPNCCDSDEVGKCGCLHSEENAVINCNAPRSVEKIVFVTHLPCKMCAKRLINLGGVKKVYYLNDYRIKDSIELLTNVGINIIKFEESINEREISTG